MVKDFVNLSLRISFYKQRIAVEVLIKDPICRSNEYSGGKEGGRLNGMSTGRLVKQAIVKAPMGDVEGLT